MRHSSSPGKKSKKAQPAGTPKRTRKLKPENNSSRDLRRARAKISRLTEEAMIGFIARDIRDLAEQNEFKAPIPADVTLDFLHLLFLITSHANATIIFEKSGLTDDELAWWTDTCTQFFARWQDFALGESKKLLKTFAVRRVITPGKYKSGDPGDSVEDRRRFWAIRASQRLAELDKQEGRNPVAPFGRAALALDMSAHGLREWFEYKRLQYGVPDRASIRAALLKIETGWLEEIDGPGAFDRKLAEKVLAKIERGEAIPIVAGR